MAQHRAIALDGPLASDQTLTVDDHDLQGRWPSPIVWTAAPNERHVYSLHGMALTSAGGVPTYRHERTLGQHEPEPASKPTSP